MRILVDAMGGDNAPDQIALGAIQAAKDFGCEAVPVSYTHLTLPTKA